MALKLIFKLNPKKLELITGLSDTLSASVANFGQIKWLDLSFNELTCINSELSQVNS